MSHLFYNLSKVLNCTCFPVEYSVEYNFHNSLNSLLSYFQYLTSDASFLRVVEFASKDDMKAALKKLDYTELKTESVSVSK